MSSDRSNDSRNRTGRSSGTVRESAPSRNLPPQNSDSAVEMRDAADSLQETMPASTDNQSSGLSTQIASKYESDLAQKDELISALVQELEQAVEQLDRFERTGADRSHSGSSSKNQITHSDSRSNQLSDLDSLRRMAEDWEETQPGPLLMRIESQLAAVHDLVLHLQRDERPRTDPAEIDDRIRRLYHETDQTIVDDATDVTIDESSTSWESIKQQILGGDVPAPSASSAEAEDSELLKLMSETPAPVDVDLNTADIETLKMALVERDTYIIQLNRLYRTRNTLSIPTDWAALANVPAEMQIRVDTLVQRLDVQVRLGEVEMSLERARLARERSQIQSEREQIEKHLRRLGLNSIADLNNISAATGNTSDRRWMRFLGPNTK